MNKIKAFLIFFLANTVVCILPVILRWVMVYAGMFFDISYVLWYLLVGPFFANLILFLVMRKVKSIWLFSLIFLIITYGAAYFVAMGFVYESFSNFRLSI